MIPDYWDIGDVYERVIEDSYEDKDIYSGLLSERRFCNDKRDAGRRVGRLCIIFIA